MRKETFVNDIFVVKPGFWHKFRFELIKGLFPAYLFLGFAILIPMFHIWYFAGEDKEIWTILIYRLSESFVGVLGSFILIFLVMKYMIVKAYFKTTEVALINKFFFKTKIIIDKLTRIEQVVNEDTGEFIFLKFYSSQALYFGAVRLDNSMFDLDEIISKLNKIDSIPQDLWIKFTIKTSKAKKKSLLYFGVVLILTLLYWSLIWTKYQFLNIRPHGLVYVFPVSFILQTGVHKIGFGTIAVNFVLSLFVNLFLVISIFQILKFSFSKKCISIKILLWSVSVVLIFLLLFYNYLCLTYCIVE